MSRNEINSHFVSRHLELAIQDALDLSQPETFLEGLAQAQALLLYTCIQVFGTDFRSHVQAMRLIHHLDATAFRLHDFASAEAFESPSEPLPLFPLSEAKDLWRTWLRHLRTSWGLF